MMPINEGTTTSNTSVIAVTNVTASRCSATVKKPMPIAPCTMIAHSSGSDSRDHEMPVCANAARGQSHSTEPKTCGARHDDGGGAILHPESDEPNDQRRYRGQQDDPIVDQRNLRGGSRYGCHAEQNQAEAEYREGGPILPRQACAAQTRDHGGDSDTGGDDRLDQEQRKPLQGQHIAGKRQCVGGQTQQVRHLLDDQDYSGQPHHFGGALGGDRLQNRGHAVSQAGDDRSQPAQHQHAREPPTDRIRTWSTFRTRSRFVRGDPFTKMSSVSTAKTAISPFLQFLQLVRCAILGICRLESIEVAHANARGLASKTAGRPPVLSLRLALRISAIVDARFGLIADGVSM